MNHPFVRSKCACETCVERCRSMPGCLAPDDLETIATHLGRSVEDTLSFFRASPGALVGDAATGKMFRINTIVPDAKPDGSCVFLDGDDRCTIHGVAPYGCAFFDCRTSKKDGDERVLFMLRRIARDEEYKKHWHDLWLRGRCAPAPEFVRKEMRNG